MGGISMNQSNRRWIAGFLLLSMAFLSAIFAVQGALLSAMIDAYALTASRQGLANATAFAGGIAALVTAFFLQGRFRKRSMLKAAMALCAVGLALLWCAPNYALFSLIWFAVGYGLGLLDTLLSACMADLYTGDAATRMMCILHTAFGLTSVLTPMLYAGLLSAGMPWKRVYLVIAGAGTVLLCAAAVLKKARNIHDGEVLRANQFSLQQTMEGLRGSRILPMVAALFFHGLFLSGLNTWVNRYADMLPGSISIPAQSCLFLGIMLSRLLFPFLHMSARKYVRIAGLLGAIVLAMGLLAASGIALRAALVLTGLMVGALIPCILSLGCAQMRDSTLLATTALMLALYLGQSLSSPIIAALESAINLKAGMAFCAVNMALCSLCCFGAKPAVQME